MSKATVTGGENGLYFATIEKTDGTPEVRQAYCADLTEDLSGTVGVLEIAGDIDKGVNIQPGHEGNAVYNAIRDGEMYEVPQKPGTQPSTGVYYNWALRAGWQKWKPNYRYGEIGGIDRDADTCDITLDECLATDNQLNVNQSDVLVGVPVEYMSCNSAAFSVGDRVIVKFENNDWESPKVIGFESEPKPCTWESWSGPETSITFDSVYDYTDIETDSGNGWRFLGSLYSKVTYTISEDDKNLSMVNLNGEITSGQPTVSWNVFFNDQDPIDCNKLKISVTSASSSGSGLGDGVWMRLPSEFDDIYLFAGGTEYDDDYHWLGVGEHIINLVADGITLPLAHISLEIRGTGSLVIEFIDLYSD